ncbi:MAG: AAA family ATPase [Gammaproteobacteria bacterium]|nr:AAA family ATPase [Gammaproteobacteria bacterium]MCY4227611.1 AAA family ATPase [Gammaproteobacteria bacterium]
MLESDAKLKFLFHAGDGRIPPYLAGREQEEKYFQDSVDLLIRKYPSDQNMIIYGPRGNGKTALLRYLQEATLKAVGDKLDILWVTPSQFKDLAQLAGLIVGNDQGLFRKALKLFDDVTASANIGMASVSTSLSHTTEMLALQNLLSEKSQKKPFILIIDEAHMLPPDIGYVLLNASQNVRAENFPFFLVLAGTPNLETALSQASASFWDKSKIFPLGRLSVDDAHKALSKPLESCQVACVEEALVEVIDRAHCYPYFIQIWGNCIAGQLAMTGSRRVTMETLSTVKDEVIADCSNIYILRHNELDKMGLVPLAADIGDAFAENDNQPIQVHELADKVRVFLQKQEESATHDTIQVTMQKLLHIGYIWKISVTDKTEEEVPLLCYEPGIPSLMEFIRRQRRPKAEMAVILERYQNSTMN